MYYTEKELLKAVYTAEDVITKLYKDHGKYIRGINDCFALLSEYDKALRGYTKSKVVEPPWESSAEWRYKLRKAGYTLKSYAEYCNYEIIPSKRPKLGDIAFEGGSAMIAGDGFWYSVPEDNLGVRLIRQIMFFERHLIILARPRK